MKQMNTINRCNKTYSHSSSLKIKKMNYKALLYVVSFCISIGYLQAQNISSKLIDEKTNESIPFATIQFTKGRNASISNSEGVFSIQLKESFKGNDSLFISCMGYDTKTISALKFNDSIIYLTPKVFELKSVLISNKVYTADEIIDQVLDNFEENHEYLYLKKKLFIRESYKQTIKTLDFGFKKSTIEEINEKLIDSIENSIPKNIEYFNETLLDIYEDKDDEENKIKIIKTLWLEDDAQRNSFKRIEEKTIDMLERNAKKGSYLKFKSGIIPLGSKIQIDSIVNSRKEKTEKQKSDDKQRYFDYEKGAFSNFLNTIIDLDDSEIDVLKKNGRYHFEIDDYIDIDDHLAYEISFSPESSADFKGKIYINVDDFAVLRIDVESAQPVFDRKFNMFGIHFNQLTYKASVFFSKGIDKYYVKYIRRQMVEEFSIDRPLKIIEKNKKVRGRRKQNEMSFDMNMKMYNSITKEAIVYENTKIGEPDFDAYKENIDFKIDRLSKFDPSFWDGYNIIAPNEAVKSFDVTLDKE